MVSYYATSQPSDVFIHMPAALTIPIGSRFDTADPRVHPVLCFNCLSTQDRKEWVEAIRVPVHPPPVWKRTPEGRTFGMFRLICANEGATQS